MVKVVDQVNQVGIHRVWSSLLAAEDYRYNSKNVYFADLS